MTSTQQVPIQQIYYYVSFSSIIRNSGCHKSVWLYFRHLISRKKVYLQETDETPIIMKRFFTCFLLSVACLNTYGQGHTVFSSEDPAFDFINTYLPEYYYEEYSQGKYDDIEIAVRTLFNYQDEKTFTYYTLSTKGDWACIDIEEIDSIINYLKRVSDKASAPSKNATMVYNSRRGFMFETNSATLSGRSITLHFPKNGPECIIRNPEGFAKLLEKGKQFIKYDTQFVSLTDSFDSEHGYYATKANARLRARNVVGSLPKPRAVTREKGIVVVQISVDQYGNVIEAVPGAEGTTIFDDAQLNATRNAAMKAHFNASANAPVTQTGTITYTFDKQSDE